MVVPKDLRIAFWAIGHGFIGLAYGMAICFVPWLVIGAPQIVLSGSSDILANNIARPLAVGVISIGIVWSVAGYLKPFNARAVWYGFIAWMVSIICSLPFMLFSVATGRQRSFNQHPIVDFFHNPGDYVAIFLVAGIVLGGLVFLGGVIGASMSRYRQQ